MSLPGGRFSPHAVEDLAESIAHPETLYLGIDMRQPRRAIRKAVEQAIRKWQPVYRAAQRRKPHGRFSNYPLYMRVYDLRIQEGRPWEEIGRTLYPQDRDPENRRRKAMHHFKQAKSLIEDVRDVLPRQGLLAEHFGCLGTEHQDEGSSEVTRQGSRDLSRDGAWRLSASRGRGRHA